MKRSYFLRTTFLTVSASALMLGASHGSSIGINFQGSGYSYAIGNYTAFGLPVTKTAFGIAPANWHSTTGNNGTNGAVGSETFSPASGGSLTVSWNAANTWVSDVENGSASPSTGEGQVEYAYLDDSANSNLPGSLSYSVSISGLTSFLAANNATAFTIQLVGASQSALNLGNVDLITSGGTQALSYSFSNTTAGFLAGLSSTSTNLTDDSITIDAPARTDGNTRYSLSGIIITPVLSVPEPSTMAMLFGGGLLFMRRRRG